MSEIPSEGGEGVVARGQCLCGAVGVTARAPTNQLGVCHCSMCRTWTGGPMMCMEGPREQLTIDHGEDNITVFSSSDWGERGFCRTCGTHLFCRVKEGKGGDHCYIPVGLLCKDRPEGWEITMQIFIDEKPSFYSLANETPTLTGEQFLAFVSQGVSQASDE